MEHLVRWSEHSHTRSLPWQTSGRPRATGDALVVGDELSADRALRLAETGTPLLWRGDFRNARHLVDALKRRLDRRPPAVGRDPADTFHRHRQARSHRARILGMVLVELDEDQAVPLPHAPDVRLACAEAFAPGAAVISVVELVGVIGAHEWRRKGVEIGALGGARIHPHYGVLPPTRQEYVDLVATAPWPAPATVFDVGTGSGVLAAVLARRGAGHVLGTDLEPRAVACARDNVERLGLTGRVDVEQTDLFPAGRADLVVCNPPWIPATPTSALDSAVYDRRGAMLAGFLRRLPDHLAADGEAWLVLSDLAEILGLRTRADLEGMIAAGGLEVRGRLDTRPRPRKERRAADPIARFREAETVSLWRLGSAGSGQRTRSGM